jgi:hypothetical protein
LVGIHTTFGRALTGGTVAMHKLAYELAIRGHNVYTFCPPEYPHENIRVIRSEFINDDHFYEICGWEPFEYNQHNTVSIYPQITRKNPYNTHHVVRWLLYDTELDVESAYGENDVYANYGNFKSFRKKEDMQLTVFDYNFDKLYQTNSGKRKGFCHIMHKHTPPDGLNVLNNLNSIDLGNWKSLGCFEYLREQFNQYEYFLTYDQKSFFTLAAGLCGTKAIILNPGPQHEYNHTITPLEYRLANPIQMFGVAYGWDDIQWANNTVHMVKDHLKEIEKIDKKTVDDFVEYWETKILQ